MIANMNEKGRQTKLLAAVAILAMVVCAFAVAMPSNEVQGVDSYSSEAYADTLDFTIYEKEGTTYVSYPNEDSTATKVVSGGLTLTNATLAAGKTVNVTMTGGTISGSLIIVASDADTVDAPDIIFTMTGGTIDGGVFATYGMQKAYTLVDETSCNSTAGLGNFSSPLKTARDVTLNISGDATINNTCQPAQNTLEVKSYVVNISEDAQIPLLYTNGSNGYIHDITIEMSGGHVGYINGQRAKTDTLTYNITGGEIDYFTIGTDTEGANNTESGNMQTAYVIGNVSVNVSEDTVIDNMILGAGIVDMPKKLWNNNTPTDEMSGTVTINAPGKTVMIQNSFYDENGNVYILWDYDFGQDYQPSTKPVNTAAGFTPSDFWNGENVFDAAKELIVTGGQLQMPESASYTGMITFGTGDATSSASVNGLVAGENGITMSSGSVRISGTITGEDVTIKVENGQVEITGGVASEITVDGTEGEIILDGVEIGNGASLTIPNGVSVTVPADSEGVTGEGSLNVAGILTVEEGATYTVTTNKTSTDAVITGIDEESVTSEITEYNALANGAISGNGANGGTWTYDSDNGALILNGYNGSSYFFTENLSTVTVSGNVIIEITDTAAQSWWTTNNTFSAISNTSGDLTIAGDGTLTISFGEMNPDSGKYYSAFYSGGSIIIDSDVTVNGATIGTESNAAKMTVNGNLTAESVVGDVTVNANAVADIGSVNGNVTVAGSVDIDSLDVSGNLTVADGATLVVDSLEVAGSINNGGIIIVNDQFTYGGSTIIVVNLGIPQNVTAGSICYLGDNYSNIGVVSVVNPQNPIAIEDGTYITSTVPSADEITGYNNVLIVSDVTFNEETLTVDYNVVGEASGTVTLNAGVALTSSTATDLTVNGVKYSSVKATGASVVSGTVTIDGDITALTLSETVPVTVNGSIISGDVVGIGSGENADNTTLTFTNVDLTGLVMTAGSVEISGTLAFDGVNATIDGAGTLVIAGNTTITGTGKISVHSLIINQGVTLTIGEGVVIELDGSEEDSLLINTGATLTGAGSITLLNQSTGITNNGTLDVKVDSGTSASIDVDTADAFVNALPYYTYINVTAVLEFETGEGITYPASISVENKVITIGDNAGFDVGEGVTLSFVGTTVLIDEGVNGYSFNVNEKGFLVIDDSDIYANVVVKEQSLTLRNNVTNIDGSSIYLTSVGFGKVVNFNNNYNLGSGSELDVYGTLNVAEGYTLTVGNATVNVMASGAVNVSGILNMNGGMNVDGKVTVAGTISVDGNLAVVNNGKVDVTGSMSVTGTLGGKVLNHGSITFAGTADDAVIDMYDGSNLAVTSMAGDGTMTVNGATSYVAPETIPAEYVAPALKTSSVTLVGVSGLSVSASEAITTQKNDDNKDQSVYTVTLDISGAVTTTSAGSIATDIAAGGKVTVEGTLDLASGVTMTFGAGDYTINGTINAANGAYIANDGTITVVGEITTVGYPAVAVDGINGAYYDMTTAAVGTTPAYVTRTYTSLATAVGVTNADNSTVFAVGEITIPVGETITVPAGLVLNNNAGIINVEGTLVFENFATGYVPTSGANIVADVMIVEDPARTYTSLANAIDMAGSETTTITLNKDVTVKDDLIIPANVTVASNQFHIAVGETTSTKDVTLTVEGSVQMTGTSDGIVLVTGAAKPNVTPAENYEGALNLVGNGYVYLTAKDTSLNDVPGAHYNVMFDHDNNESTPDVNVNVIATVEKAAADSALAVVPTGSQASAVPTIDIVGDVDAVADLTFTAAEDGSLAVTISGDFTAQTITLGQDVGMTVSGKVTGYVTDGTATVDLDGVKNISIENAAHTENETESYRLEIAGINETSITGDVAVSAGTVYIVGNVDFDAAVGTGANAVPAGTLTVASGATAVVEGTVTLSGELAVDGTLQIVVTTGSVTIESDGEAAISGTVEVAGTMDLDGKTAVTGTIEVTGTLNINAETSVEGTIAPGDVEAGAATPEINVNNIVTVGSKPTEFGQASESVLNGVTVIESEMYIKAYNGATVGFVEGYEAVSTVFNIMPAGGEYYAYMTVYANAGEIDAFTDVIYNEVFALQGYDTGLKYQNNSGLNTVLYNCENWYTGSDRVSNTALTGDVKIGSTGYTALYAQVELVEVSITVAEGNGITVYIDGMPASSLMGERGTVSLTIGTHKVSYDIKAGYNGDNVTVTFNGQPVTDGLIDVTAGSAGYVLSATGAVPSDGSIVIDNGSNDMSLTDILLIILVILIVIMAIIVALRLMRS